MNFFRISQVALADMLNHTQAGKIKISIKNAENGIELLIHDSGNGFTTDLSKQSNGLIRIQERANSINGKITVQNNLTNGVAISLIVEKQYSSFATQ